MKRCALAGGDCVNGGPYLWNPQLNERLCKEHARGVHVRSRHWEYDDCFVIPRPRGKPIPLVEAYRTAGFRLCWGCNRVLGSGGFAIAQRGGNHHYEEGCHPPSYNWPGCDPYLAGHGSAPPGVHYGSSLGELFSRAIPPEKRIRTRRIA